MDEGESSVMDIMMLSEGGFVAEDLEILNQNIFNGDDKTNRIFNCQRPMSQTDNYILVLPAAY
jgi:hypothetical protein